MKTKSPLKDLTLIQIILRFDTDEKARKHLEQRIVERRHCMSALPMQRPSQVFRHQSQSSRQDTRRTSLVFRLSETLHRDHWHSGLKIQKSRSANGLLLGI